MTTLYCDLEGGNDASDALSFANRAKTLTTGIAASDTAPGDTVRIMKSPDPTSCSINATWTNKSATVTLASALTKTVSDCDAAWTAATNVTATTTTIRTQGTNAASLAIAAAFTTGLAAYKALGGATDFSGYQQLTFWIRASATLASGRLSIKLCSDAAGATPVDTFAVPEIFTANSWIPVTVDKGSALGSSIQSVALYVDVDPGTVTVLIDNIETAKAPGNDALHMGSLIGKNGDDGYWWPIRSILGTTVILETNHPNALGAVLTTNRGYYGTSETVTLYKREPIRLTAQTLLTINESGTSGSPITFSGGWNTTDMTTQTGETWIDGRLTPGSNGMTGGVNYITLEKIRQIGFNSKLGSGSISLSDWTYNDCQSINANVSHFFINIRTTMTNVVALGGGQLTSAISGQSGSSITANSSLDLKILSHSTTSASCWLAGLQNCTGTVKVHNCSSGPAMWFNRCRLTLLEIKDCAAWQSAALTICGAQDSIIDSLVMDNPGGLTAQIGVGLGSSAPYMDTVINNLVIRGGSIAGDSGLRPIGMTSLLGTTSVRMHLNNVDMGTFSFNTPQLYYDARVYFQKFDQTADDHRVYCGATTTGSSVWTSETSVRHTASGYAWKCDLATSVVEADPVYLELAKIWCVANQAVTASIWMRRNNTARNMKLFVRGGQIAGVGSDVSTEMTASADTWEQVTVTFTPTEDGPVQLEVHAWGGTTGVHFGYVDDFTVSQNGDGPVFSTLDYPFNGKLFFGPAAQDLSSVNGRAAAEMFGGTIIK